jgi:hypothetical protein
MTDVDLLLPFAELERALDVLLGAGWQLPARSSFTHYIRSSHHLPLASPGPVSVDFEIHWNLAQETRFSIDAAGLFRRATELDVAGRRILRLEDHDFVAHLLLHHFTHYFDWQLKWALDLRAVSSAASFDWGRVAERVRSWKAATVCGYAALHLEKLVPRWIPDQLLRDLPVSGWRRALTAPLQSSHPLELFRNTRSRRVQLYLAAVMLENPLLLPRWMVHRALRDRRAGANPLEGAGARPSRGGEPDREDR